MGATRGRNLEAWPNGTTTKIATTRTCDGLTIEENRCRRLDGHYRPIDGRYRLRRTLRWQRRGRIKAAYSRRRCAVDSEKGAFPHAATDTRAEVADCDRNARSDFGRRFRTCHAQSPRTLLRAADRDVVDPLWVFRRPGGDKLPRAHLPTLTISKIPSGVPSRQTNSRLYEHSVGNVVNEFLTLKGQVGARDFN
jgi:hypothetical protein